MPQASRLTHDTIATVAPPSVRVTDVEKHFGANHVLHEINLTLLEGQVHAFVGENGAGKSTLLGILAGRLAPTSGSVEIFGRPLETGKPRAARAAGVTAIYQELTIVPALSAQANVFLGQTESRWAVLSEHKMRCRYLELCEALGIAAHADAPAGTLSVAEQQLLEVMRALITDARVILFDEPTAALAEAEREVLFKLMRDLRARGLTQVLVSHNLDEILSISDTVTVFREGRRKASRPTADWSKSQLVEAMLGEELSLVSSRRPTPRAKLGEPLLRIEGLTIPGRLSDVCVEACAGEIVGIGGLMGAGRSSVLRALAGLEPESTGRIWIRGRERRWPRSARAALALGLALVPEDRKGQGLALQLSGAENIVMSDYAAVSRCGWLSPGRAASRAGEVGVRVDLDPRRLRQPSASLSGGNQQKLMLARWFHAPPAVLLADEPTRGIDIGAKAEILAALTDMADRGNAVIVVSSELEEVIAVADRISVLSGGRVVDTFDCSQRDVTVRDVLTTAFHSGSSE